MDSAPYNSFTMNTQFWERRGKLEDLDVWISTDTSNAAAVFTALNEFGYSPTPLIKYTP
jgi:hypothetical protein